MVASIRRSWGERACTSGHIELDVGGALVADVGCTGKGVLGNMRRGHAERLLVWGIRRGSESGSRTGGIARCRGVVVVSGREEKGSVLGVGGLGLVVKGVCVGVVLNVDVLHRVVRWGLARRVARHDDLFSVLSICFYVSFVKGYLCAKKK